MAGSILNSYLEDGPYPGEHPSVEHIRASFTLASSVASVAHSFVASYANTPEVFAGPATHAVEVWVDSRSASGATFNVKTLHQAQTGSSQASIQVDFLVQPDLS